MPYRYRFIFAFVMLLLAAAPALAQNPMMGDTLINPVLWTFSSKKISQSEYELIFSADIAETYQTFSMYSDAKISYPTAISYENPQTFELVGKAVETSSKPENRLIKRMGDPNDLNFRSGTAICYIRDFEIRQRIRLKDSSTTEINGSIISMAAGNAAVTSPMNSDFSLRLSGNVRLIRRSLPIRPAAATWQKALELGKKTF